MPVSVWLGLEYTLEAIVSRRPQAVLDVGLGFGLWGHLLRQYLDVWEGNIQREQWQIRIDGVEIEAARIQPHSHYLYSNTYVGDARQVVPQQAAQVTYDVILFGDVLEHLPKPDSMVLLKQAIWLAASTVVIRIPLGLGWREEGRTPPDHHRSKWWVEDFAAFSSSIRLYKYHGADYGVIVINCAATRATTYQGLGERLLRIEQALARLLAQQPKIKEQSDE